ncbi:MAG: hypothetical protein GX868_13720, partial [Actinobacteria bacterium]|nr:hypothetical protein [Actinomycetota bacterium]
LGLDPFTDYRSDAGWDRVIAAHRSIVKRFHPDRFVESPQSEQEAAMDRTVTANHAYTVLRSARRSAPRYF